MNDLIIILIFILIVFLVTARLYYLSNNINDKSDNITTIIPFSKFSENCPSRSKDNINNICAEHNIYFPCKEENCSNYHFHKVNQAIKRFNQNKY